MAFDMDRWKRLAGVKSAPRRAAAETVEVDSWIFDDCTEWIATVGESHYQGALMKISGSTTWEAVRFECQAALVPEPDNAYDSNAVRVFADCRGDYIHVGYLSRGDALDYTLVVQGAAERGYTIACDAHIAGREPGSETHNLGIFLELPTPEECLKQLAEPMADPA
jgi:hypothetical protein